jgi:hypothetical protein
LPRPWRRRPGRQGQPQQAELGYCHHRPAALGLLTAGLIMGGADGWDSPTTLGLLAAGAGFWLAGRHGRHPMLPLPFLRHRVRTTAVINAGRMGFVFYALLSLNASSMVRRPLVPAPEPS